MHFIATYEIEASPGEPHQRFLESALERGWRNMLCSGGVSERLPSNTLVGEFRNLDEAHRSFDRAIEAASRTMSPAHLRVERRFIVERAAAGRLKAMRRQWVQTNIARLTRLLRPTLHRN